MDKFFYYKFSDPYYALIAAKDMDEAFNCYTENVADAQEIDAEMLTKHQFVEEFKKGNDEDGQKIGNKSFKMLKDIFREEPEATHILLLVDSSLI